MKSLTNETEAQHQEWVSKLKVGDKVSFRVCYDSPIKGMPIGEVVKVWGKKNRICHVQKPGEVVPFNKKGECAIPGMKQYCQIVPVEWDS
jgi:hypothetical protein